MSGLKEVINSNPYLKEYDDLGKAYYEQLKESEKLKKQLKALYDAAMKADYTKKNGADDLCKVLDGIDYNKVFGGE